MRADRGKNSRKNISFGCFFVEILQGMVIMGGRKERKKKMTKKKSRKKLLLIIPIVLVALVAAFLIYVSIYYHAQAQEIQSFTENASVSAQIEDGCIVYEPEEADTGLIFYPGGKVEYTAYEPLMQVLADKGVLCILIKMPANLAVLDVNAADGFSELYPQIEHWYMAGHSLGGSMAATYISSHAEEFEGLVLLAAYSTSDLSDTDLKVLSIYGSEDGVMNREKYQKYLSNMPQNFTELVIEGGCHAGFGMYGAQKGDGSPTISSEEQIRVTAEDIFEFME